jgi:hypothetical protein
MIDAKLGASIETTKIQLDELEEFEKGECLFH